MSVRAPRGEHLLNGSFLSPRRRRRKFASLRSLTRHSLFCAISRQPRAEPGPPRCAQSLTITTACACQAHRPQGHLLAAGNETGPPPSGTQQNRGLEGGQRSGSSGGAGGGGPGGSRGKGSANSSRCPRPEPHTAACPHCMGRAGSLVSSPCPGPSPSWTAGVLGEGLLPLASQCFSSAS